MIANYHTHTVRCRHANGTEREFIEMALESGLQVLGFSDHTPYPFRGDYYSNFRMPLAEAEDYFRTITDLKAEYAGQIEIHVGVEAEYYPDLFPGLMDFLRQFPCEYMIMGQHFPGNEEDQDYITLPRNDPELLKQYMDQVTEGLETGLFTYAAHPDCFCWQGDPEVYRQVMTKFCRRAKEQSWVLEYNLLGHHHKKNYPNPAFWEIAAEVGNTVILGADAHYPWMLNRRDDDPEFWKQTEEEALAYLHGLGMTPLDTVELKPIK